MTIIEGMFAQPLIRAYNSEFNRPYAIWYRWHLGHMKHLNTKLSATTQWLGVDYSAFDVNVAPWLIRDAFAILKEQLNFNEYEFYGKPTDPETIEHLWSEVQRYFINTPIRLKSGKIWVKSSGVPSGSYFTNLVDSVCNAIMTHYTLSKMNVRYYEHYFMGDDGLIRVKDLNIEKFAETVKEAFGAIVNPEKSEMGKYVHWLG